MQFEAVKIGDFPPFKDFSVELPSGITVIAGTNGVGKSRLLTFLVQQARSPMFPGGSSGVRFRQGQAHGKVVHFEANRVIPYVPVSSLRPYQQRYNSEHGFIDQNNFSSVGTTFKNWFVQMDYFSLRGWIETPESRDNFETCKMAFSFMDSRYRFLEVDREFNIIIDTPIGPLPFEQTSSGFQSAFLLLFGVIFGIDRFFDGRMAAKDFDGSILIDEIDVHLHPSWQGKILHILQQIVPHAQIIATTHSPHVIQGLKESELIVLGTGPKGQPEIKSIRPKPGPFGFQGWTIEEILRDVMGIEDSLSEERQQVEMAFNDALDDDDLAAAQAPYEKLMSMLHPTNPLRRVYDMQFRAMGGLSS